MKDRKRLALGELAYRRFEGRISAAEFSERWDRLVA